MVYQGLQNKLKGLSPKAQTVLCTTLSLHKEMYPALRAIETCITRRRNAFEQRSARAQDDFSLQMGGGV